LGQNQLLFFSVRYTERLLILLFAAALNIAGSTTVAAADWPDGYVVYEKTESPDGRYGILVPSMEAWEKDESLGETNYLADLKNHRLMGKIRGADYFEHQNHRGLQVVWAPDSSWCVVEYDERFGFGSISILEPKGSAFVQTDIGKRVGDSLNSAVVKKSHDRESGAGDAVTYFRIGPDGKLRVRALSTTDPKQLNPEKAHYALFHGMFDLRSKKWQTAEAQTLKEIDEYTAVEGAFTDLDSELEGTSFSTEEDKAKWLDERMNAVYATARLIQPAARFAAVKKEQIEWLKKRDAAPSIEEKCKLMEAQIKALQELLW
jgi:uncharacterized protein YecT (DUF1311 family)